MVLLDLPDGPLSRIVAYLPMRSEAALSRTCKEAQRRCRGRLYALKRIYAESDGTDKLDVVALFGLDSYKRCLDEYLLSDNRKRKRCKWLDKYGPPPLDYGNEDALLPQPVSCDFSDCESDAEATVDGHPLCVSHALESICEQCGKPTIDGGGAVDCRACASNVCFECRTTVRTGVYYCLRCSRRITIDGHCSYRRL